MATEFYVVRHHGAWRIRVNGKHRGSMPRVFWPLTPQSRKLRLLDQGQRSSVQGLSVNLGMSGRRDPGRSCPLQRGPVRSDVRPLEPTWRRVDLSKVTAYPDLMRSENKHTSSSADGASRARRVPAGGWTTESREALCGSSGELLS